MAHYVALCNWTQEGIKDARNAIGQMDRALEYIEKRGAKIKAVYWTLGQYDMIVVLEGPDDEHAVLTAMGIGAAGLIRTTTLRAFDRDEMAKILAAAAG